MADLIRVEYARTGGSTTSNDMGMREMQARAFEKRNSQYLLLKAPPASGKSRALMFLGLDKLHRQGLHKVIVAVPEMSIGGSFGKTDLTRQGFFADWEIADQNNLCRAGSDKGKVEVFCRFMRQSEEHILVCTHATLRFAFDRLAPEEFDHTLVAIDEFHHVSADESNRLGALIDTLMNASSAHIVAMTGSYFRGDAAPILLPEDEERFDKVTYTYYEQLNGYRYLKSLGIGYHFYKNRYIDAVSEVLNPDQKTIVHIPNVNSGESTKDKYGEVDRILDILGNVEQQDATTGIFSVRHASGRLLKVANLVEDNSLQRPKVVEYLRQIKSADDMDIIIALGMAKEGFDWPWCEHVLTIGYRNSMTEIIQIIGRATRDNPGKVHAQFTNLIAQPDAEDDDVRISVNNMLKAITVSLLMEQVLAPSVTFKPRSRMQQGEPLEPGTVVIEDTAAPVSARLLDILNNGGKDDIVAALVQAPSVTTAAVVETTEPEVINQVELPKVIERLYPELDDNEREMLREGVLTSMLIRSGGGLFDEEDLPKDALIQEPTGVYNVDHNPGTTNDTAQEGVPLNGAAYDETPGTGSSSGNRQFVRMGDKFINIEHLNVDLIDRINPFQGAYEILSKSVTSSVLKTIQDTVIGSRVQMSEEEAVILWPGINEFVQQHGREPNLHSDNHIEVRYAEALAYIKHKKAERGRSMAS
ncbi:helicase-like protein [Kushneria sinocarnis]|uniref:Helicase-like protein n=1 Tax=Kushneria sinocarnis TaxID=595502 RepID=A0A420X190_9GAMM|nr:helicase-related protein [Kushneria sinocarnis]RKR07626.1 helicase-like protein [Kushneria sinocarnis]